MGALAGVMEAQYDVLRMHGHTPSEAFNETVEELTQSLIRLVDETAWTGCSPTARPRPSAVRWIGSRDSRRPPCRFSSACITPSSRSGTRRVIATCGKPDYQHGLTKELNAMGNSEMWRAGKAARALRPKEASRAITKGTKGVAGRKA